MQFIHFLFQKHYKSVQVWVMILLVRDQPWAYGYIQIISQFIEYHFSSSRTIENDLSQVQISWKVGFHTLNSQHSHLIFNLLLPFGFHVEIGSLSKQPSDQPRINHKGNCQQQAMQSCFLSGLHLHASTKLIFLQIFAKYFAHQSHKLTVFYHQQTLFLRDRWDFEDALKILRCSTQHVETWQYSFL